MSLGIWQCYGLHLGGASWGSILLCKQIVIIVISLCFSELDSVHTCMFYLSIVAKSRSRLEWCVFAHSSFIAVTQLLPANISGCIPDSRCLRFGKRILILTHHPSTEVSPRHLYIALCIPRVTPLPHNSCAVPTFSNTFCMFSISVQGRTLSRRLK